MSAAEKIVNLPRPEPTTFDASANTITIDKRLFDALMRVFSETVERHYPEPTLDFSRPDLLRIIAHLSLALSAFAENIGE